MNSFLSSSGRGFLGSVLQIAHVALMIFVVLAPFVVETPDWLIAHAMTCVSLMVHWHYNTDVCCLSALESYLRGIPLEQGMAHRIIAPFYAMPARDFSSLVWTVTATSMSLSLARLVDLAYTHKIYPSFFA
jgi:hypothetical protein